MAFGSDESGKAVGVFFAGVGAVLVDLHIYQYLGDRELHGRSVLRVQNAVGVHAFSGNVQVTALFLVVQHAQGWFSVKHKIFDKLYNFL